METLLPLRRMALENEEILLNSFRRSVETLRKNGVDCSLEKKENEGAFILTIFISKKQKISLQSGDDMI